MRITFTGHELILDASGVAMFPELSMAVVSDMHLEKGSHFARRGFFLPPYDSHATLTRLLDFFTRHPVRTLVILGDCFHDAKGYGRMEGDARGLFDRLLAFNTIWIQGNHDGNFVPEGLVSYETYEHEGLIFRHQALPGAKGEISGHFHPKASLIHKGAKIERDCFVEDGAKLIMPAFGSYTGGLSIGDPVISGLLHCPFRFYVFGDDKVYGFDSEILKNEES